jgi:aldehyde dehydrogenase (NAD+)
MLDIDGMTAIQNILASQRQFFNSGRTKDLDFRLKNLSRLKKAIIQNEAAILEALKNDLYKSAYEGYLTEIGLALEEIRFVSRHLRSWAKPRKVRTPYVLWFGTSAIYPEPYGISLIISPWNYPFQLTILPLIGSMAAGNCTMVKPSEYAPRTSAIISEIIERLFDSHYVAIIEGDAQISEDLLNERFDYILFTGSEIIGKIVMAAAAKNLTPITLELGGKSPCIVDQDVNIDLAARRIASGKFINAGQTCTAPDYLLVHQSNKQKLLDQIKVYLHNFYGEDPRTSPDYVRIINKPQFDRLAALLDQGDIIVGGQTDSDDLYIAPTLLEQVSWDDPVMQDEIFGPILPVLEFEDLTEVVSAINSRPRPLALYFFSNQRHHYQRIIKEVSFGGGCINDTLAHYINPHLPFGGTGNSGMGSYHGKASFDTFSHQKSILKKWFNFDMPLRFPPYKNKLSILKKILR